MDKLILKTKYPDGTSLEVVYDNNVYKWKVGGMSHMEKSTLTLKKTDKCGWGTKILDNLSKKENAEVLIAGLGFGHTVETLKRAAGIKVDVVEINKDAVDFYKKNYKNKTIADNIYINDFKNYIEDTNKKYDVIFMQLDFYGFELPKDHHLYSLCVKSNIEMYNKIFFRKIYDRLKPNGYFLIDCLCTDGDTKLRDMLNDIGYNVSEKRVLGPNRLGKLTPSSLIDGVYYLTIDAKKC